MSLAPQRAFGGVSAALADSPALALVSPSKATAAESILASLACVDVCAQPLSPSLAPLAAVPPPLACWRGLSADALLREATAYPHATAYVPAWVVARARPASTEGVGGESASTLFLGRGVPAGTRPTVPGVSLPWGCFPGLLTAPRAAFHPAFNGEVKSATSAGEGDRLRLYDELLTYCMLGMLGSCFRDVPAGAHRFFRSPPHAFGLAACAHVGYLVAVEWVGKLHASVVSEPFFLGSPAHASAIARLPDRDLAAECVDVFVDGTRVAAWPAVANSRVAVIWRVEPPSPDASGGDARFFKIVRGDGFDAAFFRRIYTSYMVYAAARAAPAAGAPPPDALVDAELLFGAGEVCVRMPWAHGRDATRADLSVGGCAVAPVAAAIVWLARNGLLYTDVREPNVRVDDAGGEPRVKLVDFDDCVVVTAPATAELLIELLVAHVVRFAGRVDTPEALPAVVSALRAAW